MDDVAGGQGVREGELWEGMNRHIVEKALTGVFLVVSLVHAVMGAWQPAQYWLFMAAFVDFDDWSHGK